MTEIDDELRREEAEREEARALFEGVLERRRQHDRDVRELLSAAIAAREDEEANRNEGKNR